MKRRRRWSIGFDLIFHSAVASQTLWIEGVYYVQIPPIFPSNRHLFTDFFVLCMGCTPLTTPLSIRIRGSKPDEPTTQTNIHTSLDNTSYHLPKCQTHLEILICANWARFNGKDIPKVILIAINKKIWWVQKNLRTYHIYMSCYKPRFSVLGPTITFKHKLTLIQEQMMTDLCISFNTSWSKLEERS